MHGGAGLAAQGGGADPVLEAAAFQPLRHGHGAGAVVAHQHHVATRPQGGLGALETGLRVTHLDLADETVDGGEMTTYGLVVNWLPITRLRLSANLIQARIERLRANPVDETLLTLRTAVDW